MSCHSGGRVGSGIENVPGDWGVGGMDHGGVCHMGSEEVDREEEGGGRMKYSWERMGSAELDGKTLALTMMVSVPSHLALVVVVQY
jgi:hypothetical protein